MATDFPPLYIFVIVLGTFVVGLAIFWILQHFKAKKAAKEKERQKQNENIPMTTIIADDTAVKHEGEQVVPTVSVGESKVNHDSHSELPNAIRFEENRRSVYDSEFYVSSDRDPFAKKAEL